MSSYQHSDPAKISYLGTHLLDRSTPLKEKEKTSRLIMLPLPGCNRGDMQIDWL
jgi:hypothetical protein